MPPRLLLAALLMLTALRLTIGLALEVTPAEAALWLCGKHLAAGYFDHGPLAAWMVRLTTEICGDSAAGVRLFSPWLLLGVSLLGYRLAASAFGEQSAAWFIAVFNLIPLANVAALLGQPDTWAFSFGVLALWLIWRALHRASAWTWHWSAAGAVMGLAALSAPAGLALAPGLILLLTGPHRWRGRWRRPGPWVALVIMALVAVPWFRWQAAHQWLPLRSHWFAWWHGFSVRACLLWVWWVMMAVSPFVLAGVLWAGLGGSADGVRSWLRRRRGGLKADDPFDQKDGRVFLLAIATPGMLWAIASAVMGHGHLGLMALPGFAGLMLLVARWIETPVAPATHRLAQSATLLVAAAYSLLALDSDLARHRGLRWPYSLDPTADRRGWRETAHAVMLAGTEVAGHDPAAKIFFIGDSPRLAAALSFHLPQRPTAHVVDRLAVDSDFAFWPGYAHGAFAGRSAVFVAEAAAPPSLALLQRQFTRVESLGSVEIRRGGFVVRRLALFACRQYRGRGL